MQLRCQLQSLKQGDSSIQVYLQQAKLLSDELAAAGQPLDPIDFNLYIFKGLRYQFRDSATTLTARADPMFYSDLLSFLLTQEFLQEDTMSSLNLSPNPIPSKSDLSANYVQRAPNPSQRGGHNTYGYRGLGRRGRGRGGRGRGCSFLPTHHRFTHLFPITELTNFSLVCSYRKRPFSHPHNGRDKAAQLSNLAAADDTPKIVSEVDRWELHAKNKTAEIVASCMLIFYPSDLLKMRPSPSPTSSTFWNWKSPLPYLFGGLALMLILIAAALIILACSYRKRPSSHPHNNGERAAQLSNLAAADDTPKIVVIMAGDDNPTHLAIPIPSSLTV
ncbi:hypothetical protein BUALT_Bualt16G0025900 [Buddleja alternifolia]|uniref:Uncharacterized protein n=1 Tax=Buddleja alternifolia TaxID=168488 RepID=A0AAV6WJ44_9LAMI|nr:hypothetical protein BUALT_Bualt16G0025900 [Buddleja alternifolia]